MTIDAAATEPTAKFRRPNNMADYAKASEVQAQFTNPDGTLLYSVQKQTTMVRKGEVLAIFTCKVRIATDPEVPSTNPEESPP